MTYSVHNDCSMTTSANGVLQDAELGSALVMQSGLFRVHDVVATTEGDDVLLVDLYEYVVRRLDVRVSPDTLKLLEISAMTNPKCHAYLAEVWHKV